MIPTVAIHARARILAFRIVHAACRRLQVRDVVAVPRKADVLIAVVAVVAQIVVVAV
jgi:hypothetical protein